MLNIRYYFINYGIPIITFITSTYSFLTNNYTYYHDNVLKITDSNDLVFFHNNPSAYLSSFVNTHSANSGVIVWKFNRLTKTFYQTISSDKSTKRLPVLSATLICDDTKINLDDFIESLKIESVNYGYPTLQQVMEIWAYTSGIVLDRNKAWKINYLDTDVNEFTKCIFTDSWNFACFIKN
jgi:hypothetical protein